MKLSAIAAVAENYVIGRDNDLPWRLPADLRWFVEHTKHKPIIFGRRTFESTGYLKNRRNIVLTRDANWDGGADVTVGSLPDAIAACGEAEEAMVLGGAGLYQASESQWDTLYLTVVHARPQGDTWFPALDPNAWDIAHEEYRPADEQNPHDMTFFVLNRTSQTISPEHRPDLLPERFRSMR